ncbi:MULTISPECIES: hypothetical protein [Gordonia]|uniref:Uncharacterized protein n=2 Tax=Gordonia TaxID=2053 RepID=L7LN47_9ACTN|nr:MULTISPECIES: hypothetical protein [Gordonia]AUH69716.1 hypothetical protein CXX93_17050 [Gordonia sp. YC-JH1]KJR09857.1 hypothetical protein UG54_03040 [Gordonia sihwensis]KXT55693.1 hypothetical protein Y710_17945 [Gordonia sp. QH-12]WFN93711.1 hypothetical protein P5P27_03880 [Gordonia sihwensis]GAC62166.1 hypothetical protein GSI01S_29_00540 [Gordonia sihwensis NBRC 108236]
MVGRAERNKDLIQEVVESAAHRVGNITSIITTAVADVAREIGELVTDGFEMREAAKTARNDSEPEAKPKTPPEELDSLNGYDDDTDEDADADDGGSGREDH